MGTAVKPCLEGSSAALGPGKHKAFSLPDTVTRLPEQLGHITSPSCAILIELHVRHTRLVSALLQEKKSSLIAQLLFPATHSPAGVKAEHRLPVT